MAMPTPSMMVTILCGVSGSGKSTWADHMRPDAAVVSADHFLAVNGEYKFDPTKLGEAHGACVKAFIDFCRDGTQDVVVDNTNTSLEEINVYMAIAGAYKRNVEIVWVQADPEDAAARNTHKVPYSVVMQMHLDLARTMGNLPPWWPTPILANAQG